MYKKIISLVSAIVLSSLFTACDTEDVELSGSLGESTSITTSVEGTSSESDSVGEATETSITTITEVTETVVSNEFDTSSLNYIDFDFSSIPEFSNEPFYIVNDNIPFFSVSEELESYEYYSELDSLGRCGIAHACIGKDIMPTEERGSIGSVKPTGWHSVKYDSVDGKYLYNRCHLIGYQLSGENANTQNLITGTRYMNVDGMLPFENMVADYVKETDNHVLYRVTPYFEGEDLLSRGVLIEGKSLEDDGAGILFNVYVYNAQPDIEINYATGESFAFEPKSDITTEPTVIETEPEIIETEPPVVIPEVVTRDYIYNTNTGKIHKPSCSSVKQMNEENKGYHTGTIDELEQQGYVPCKKCNPF